MNAFKLSAEQRTAVRRAITAHADWNAYRAAHNNMTSADLTSSKCLEIAARFNINIASVIAAMPEKEVVLSDDGAAWGHEQATDNDDFLPETTTKETKTVTAIPADKNAALAALSALLTPSIDEAQIEAIVTKKVAAALEGTALVRIELTRADNSTWKSEGMQHPLFADLLTVVSSRAANGIAPNVWLAGPTGSGKTHAAEQCAKALGITFFFNGALSMSHELVGFVDAAGHYHTTPFRQAYEHGGLYLFDEVDASDNSALLALNAALANGVCAFPDSAEPVRRHKDFICIGAANTFGQGATAEFIGRAKIDAAFLSRFPVKFAWTYDIALEQAISGNVEWAKRVQAARARAQSAGVKIVIDPRHSQAGAALIAAGMSFDRAAQLTYLAGLSDDQKRIVEGR
jgi:cobaltochelatase CobS